MRRTTTACFTSLCCAGLAGVVSLGPTSATAADEQPAAETTTPALIAQRLPFGTGTRYNFADAVEGSVVIGTVSVGEKTTVFSQDYADASPTPQMLGDIGYDPSGVTAFDGRFVVGTSNLGHPDRAFYADLEAPDPRLIDLGTLGGRTSGLGDVDDGIAVGGSAINGRQHAVAVDLTSAKPVFRDLGTLGGSYAFATGVSDGVVIGQSLLAGDKAARWFRFDLNDPSADMEDLGLNANAHDIVDVDGHTAVGALHAWQYDRRELMALDLSAPDPQPTTSTAIADRSWGVAISGGLVAGDAVSASGRTRGILVDLADLDTVRTVSTPARDTSLRDLDGQVVAGAYGDVTWSDLFAADVSGPEPRLAALPGPLLAEGEEMDIVGISGDLVVGRFWGRPSRVWRLTDTTAPVFSMISQSGSVQEDVGTTSFSIRRSGDLSTQVTVDYTVSPDEGASTADFTASSGTAAFAAGQDTVEVPVGITDDARSDDQERVLVRLSNPSAGGHLGVHSSGVAVRIAPSDKQPDLRIRRADGTWLGDRVLNTTGERQTTTRSADRGRTVSFEVRLRNGSNAYGFGRFAVHTGTLPTSATVRILRGRVGATTDVTSAVTSAQGLTVGLYGGGTGSYQPTARFVVKVTPRTGAEVGARLAVRLRADWTGDGLRSDVVRSVVRVTG